MATCRKCKVYCERCDGPHKTHLSSHPGPRGSDRIALCPEHAAMEAENKRLRKEIRQRNIQLAVAEKVLEEAGKWHVFIAALNVATEIREHIDER